MLAQTLIDYKSTPSEKEVTEFFKAKRLRNKKSRKLATFTPPPSHIYFNSRFESGNLDQVYKISDYEYSLYLKKDENNANHCTQWFYFSVINCGKPLSKQNDSSDDVPNRVTFTIKNLVKGRLALAYNLHI